MRELALKFSTVTKTIEMEITSNLSKAMKTGLKYHVCCQNEVHSFNLKSEATKDFIAAKRWELKQDSRFIPTMNSTEELKRLGY